MGITEYAAHRGCDPETVRLAIINGRIVRNPDGSIDPDKADREWAEHTRPHMQGGGKHIIAGSKSKVVNGSGATEPVPGMSYVDARALKETYEAMRRRADLQLKSGELVTREQIEKAERTIHTRYRQLRDACMQIPARLAPRVAAERDEHAIYTMIQAEVRRVFQDFSEGRLT